VPYQNRRQTRSRIPGIDLIPMLNVMMAVLAFFIVISALLTQERGVEIGLPGTDPPPDEPAPPLVIRLTASGIVAGDRPLSEAQLYATVAAYLDESPESTVLLTADSEVPYEQVVSLLGSLRDREGDRVALAIEPAQ